jgi:adenine/guanine phosphoribosyltransferase-like PRPP-binding protein
LPHRNDDATLVRMQFWQDFAPAAPAPTLWRAHYAAAMPDGSHLLLPLRDLGKTAVAGLIVTQASFRVLDRLICWLAERAARHRADVVVGLPTLGHTVAQGLARALGHPGWVACGFSRKLWYDESLSVGIASITSPAEGRRLWLDPRTLPVLAGRRVLLADDVISTGRSMQAGLALLRAAGATPVAVAAAMIQGDRWREGWNPALPLCGAFATPLFERRPGGWRAVPDTAAHDLCR